MSVWRVAVLKAYNEKFIRWPRKAVLVVFPLHKSPIPEVIIHLGEKEKTRGAAGKKNLSERICSISAFMLPAESSTCSNLALF